MIERQLHKLSIQLRRAIVGSAVVCANEACALVPGERLTYLGYRLRDYFGPFRTGRHEAFFGPDIHETMARLHELGVYQGELTGPVALQPKIFDEVINALPFDKTLSRLRQNDLSEVATRILTKAQIRDTDQQITVSMATRQELAGMTTVQRERLYLDRIQQAEHMALRTFIDTLDDPLAERADKVTAARAIVMAGAGMRKSVLDARKVSVLERAANAKLPPGAPSELDKLSLQELERLQSAVTNARSQQLQVGAIDGETVPAEQQDDSPF